MKYTAKNLKGTLLDSMARRMSSNDIKIMAKHWDLLPAAEKPNMESQIATVQSIANDIDQENDIFEIETQSAVVHGEEKVNDEVTPSGENAYMRCTTNNYPPAGPQLINY